MIRKAKLADIPNIKRIDTFAKQLNRYTGLDKLDFHFKGKRSYYEDFIRGKKKWCLVAEVDNKIVGFVTFNIEKREPYYLFKKVGYVDVMVVEKKYRRKGISKLLMKEVIKTFKKEKVTHLKLSVHAENPALHIWNKHGFKEYRIDMFKKL